MQENLKILLLEDSEEDSFLIQHELKKDGISFIAECVDTREEFIEALDRFDPHLVLSDHALPQFNSIEALKICNQRKLLIPFILITGSISDRLAVDCLKQGIDDYILKGNLARLPIAIKKALIQRATQQRNKEIEQSLRVRNKELTKANEELDNFVYSVSHNLRGPLATISGLLNIAAIEVEKPGYKPGKFVPLIKKSVMALEKTIGQIIDYSRNTRSSASYTTINIHQFMASQLEVFSYLPNYKNIQFIINISKQLVAHTDLNRLAMIFHNTLANAIQYLDNDRGKVIVSAKKQGNRMIVTIEDNGAGIPEYLMKKVFDMFFRGTDKSHGAGLGLYIARDAARKIGGIIKITSQERVGTKVVVSFPDQPITNNQ